MGLRDTGGFSFRIEYLGARMAAVARLRRRVEWLAASYSIGAALGALICVTSARADLSPTCKSLNSGKVYVIAKGGDSQQVVNGVFDTNEVMSFAIEPPPNDASVAWSFPANDGSFQSDVEDISHKVNFKLSVIKAGMQTVTITNNDDPARGSSINITPSCSAGPVTKTHIQQGPPLVGSGAVGGSLVEEGYSVAASTDGNTLVVGGPGDNNGTGAAWVFVRSNGVWSQLGSKLVGTGATGGANQSYSVALSADGHTLIVGGPQDNNVAGAAWIFTQTGGVWTQQGSKLVGIGGWSVALSGDGNTAIVGGPFSLTVGAAWGFTPRGGVWTQQGPALVGTGAVGDTFQGWSVALSGDGNTAIVGGWGDNSGIGAAWVFVRSNGVWSQLGSKLVGNGAVGDASQGWSVALSGDGNTAIIGGPNDNSNGGPGGVGVGAAWVFTQSGGVWTQQGDKLGGIDVNGQAGQGTSVALSADGSTVISGGWGDNSDVGAAWVFTQSGGLWSQQGPKLVGTGAAHQGQSVALSGDGSTAVVGAPVGIGNAGATFAFGLHNADGTHDFNGDFISDLLWSDISGDVAMWLMNGSHVLQSGGLGAVPTTWSIIGQRDFNGDGKPDLLWRDTSGNPAIWFMNGVQVSSAASLGNVPTNWAVYGTGDLNGDGDGDLLWRDSNTGTVAIWFMKGSQVASTAALGQVPTNWTIVGDDNYGDIFWRDTAGDLAIWQVSGSQVVASTGLGNVPSNWVIAGLGDFNGDGLTDILWRDANAGDAAIWLMNGAGILAAGGLGNVATSWSMVQTGDFNGDGMSDLLWRDTSGNTAMWFMNGTAIASTGTVGNVALTWTVQSANAD